MGTALQMQLETHSMKTGGLQTLNMRAGTHHVNNLV